MSIFRPHKTKPRQFNYTPRYYDPRKEAMEQRRRELHGTSSESDDMPYQPGNYLRTQRDARRESREVDSKSASSRLFRYALIIIIVGMVMMYVFPRITTILERIMQDPNAVEGAETEQTQNFSDIDGATSEQQPDIVLNEQHGDIDFTEFESLTPESINEIEEWNRKNPTLTIYSDDVEIVDGKRVE